MEKVRQHFEEEAHEFDKIIRRLIPYYEQMLDALMQLCHLIRARQFA